MARVQIRRAGTLSNDEIPLEGEPLWDDQNRRLGFYNFPDGVINWFRIPKTGDSETYVPAHEWDGSFLRFQNPDGTWGEAVNLSGAFISEITATNNSDGTVTFDFAMDNGLEYSVVFRVRPIHKGRYNNTDEYESLDEVEFKGSTYRVKEGVTPPAGTLPTNGLYWDLIARRGGDTLNEVVTIPGDSHTLSLDNMGVLLKTVENDIPVTITIPAQDDVEWPDEPVIIHCLQLGDAEVVFVGDTGVTVTGFLNSTTTGGKGAMVSLVRLEENEWALTGNLLVPGL